MWCNPRKDNYGQDLIDKSFSIDPLDTNNGLNIVT